MTVEPQYFFGDALTGSDGTGAVRSGLSVPYVFPDATAAFPAKRPVMPGHKAMPGHESMPGDRATQHPAGRTQQPYPLPGPLTPARPSYVAPARPATPVSVSADIPYNPWSMAGNLDVSVGPVPPAAIPAPFTAPPRPSISRPVNSRQSGGQNGQTGQNARRPGASGRTISQGATYHRQPPTAQVQQTNQPQIPAALMAWLPPGVAAQIPMANRPPVGPNQPFGRQPAQQPPTQQFTATPQPNFRQQLRQGQQRQPQRSNQPQRSDKKSGCTGVLVFVLALIVLFSGIGREILDAILAAFNR